MTRVLFDAVSAEAAKLRTLPSIVATVTGTIGAALLLAATSTASTGSDANTGTVVADSVRFLQTGTILLGVLSVATEYTGYQIRTTLTAVPHRMVALAGKALAYLAVALPASAAALVAAAVTTWAVTGADHAAPALGVWAWQLVPAATYLTLIGLLAQAVTVLLRSLTASLVAMLGLVLIASPLLRSLTEHARWLPDHATQHLHLADVDSALAPWSGMLVLTTWIAAIGLVASVQALRRDT